MLKNEFDFEMYLDSMSQMKKMGGLSSVMGMIDRMLDEVLAASKNN